MKKKMVLIEMKSDPRALEFRGRAKSSTSVWYGSWSNGMYAIIHTSYHTLENIVFRLHVSNDILSRID